MDSTPIYAITCLEKIEDVNTWPDFGAVKFQGYYYDKETAFNAVMENRCDIAECVFDYAVIECIHPGLHATPEERWFFKYANGEYVPIEEPAVMKHIANVL